MTFFRVRPPPRFDPVKLLPSTLPRGQRFESLTDARLAWAQNRARILKPGFIGEAVSAVDECLAGITACNLPLCPRCARRYRRWAASRILRLLAELNQAFMLTIYDSVYAQGKLHELDLKRLHDRIRKRIRRAGFDQTTVIGGTEASWRQSEASWLVHLHLVVIDPPNRAVDRLRRSCARTSPSGSPSLRADPIRDPAKVATYVQKFAFWHHPGRREGPSRARAIPLPKREAREFAEFLAYHKFEDFLFLAGCRRRGAKIYSV